MNVTTKQIVIIGIFCIIGLSIISKTIIRLKLGYDTTVPWYAQ